MAGLLETIAKRLLGSDEPKRTTGRATQRPVAHTVKVKQVAPTVGPEPEPELEPETKSFYEPLHIQTEPKTTVTAIDRTVKRERNQSEVGREDLLTQIDEFREKAQMLQDLLLSKETKAMELQNIVDEREVKAKELELILNERQRKADGITEEVAKQIDNLIEKVSAKMDEIGIAIENDVKDGKEFSEQQAAELKETLAGLNAQLEVLKADLSEKVHSENVKCYRNIADLFKSMEEKLDKVDEVEQKVSSVKKCAVAIIVLTLMNMLGLVAFALYEMGIFALLLG